MPATRQDTWCAWTSGSKGSGNGVLHNPVTGMHSPVAIHNKHHPRPWSGVVFAALILLALGCPVLAQTKDPPPEDAAGTSALKDFLANPTAAEARARVTSIYRNASATRQLGIRKSLQEEYDKLIRTTPAAAKRCRDLHAALVNIASANPPVFSYALGVQMPTAFPKDKYPIGKGRPSQLVASEIMMKLGSDILKLAPGEKQLDREGLDTDDLDSLVKTIRSPVYQQVLALPYRVMFFWAHGGPYRGLNERKKAELYQEFYDFTAYLLTTYNNTGKTFMIGNWEGDWMAGGKAVGNDKDLLDSDMRAFAGWLDIRAKAIDDAKAKVAHQNVFVYSYLEINHVNRARTGGLKRLVNSVLPYSHVDYVSISSYEMQGFANWRHAKSEAAMRERIFADLNFVEDNLPPRDIPGKRVFIGEIGYTTENIQAANKSYSKAQVQKEQARLALLDAKINLEWGTPFWLWWAVHDTKGGSFGIVNQMTGEKTVLHGELQKYYQWAGNYTQQFRREHGTPPNPAAFRLKAIEELTRQIAALKPR